MSPAKLNYPAVIFRVPNKKSFLVALNRTVTNVGPPNSIYKVLVPQIDPQLGVRIDVFPQALRFKSIGEKQTFTVVASGKQEINGAVVRTSILWADGQRKGLKRLKHDEEKLDGFVKTHVSRLLKLDTIAVLGELERQEVSLAIKCYGNLIG
ncbi:hypothetical protein CRG98_043080 [Punica granatum]|uniref:Subtilisin-like protease fibronectin type-III domain-containing protein n=1 Tax=Punica granatum TaxID=22663 RepID=A0A2I0HXU6_PUNGR|nr:hypothetical protein CRG98_043080 [Punica granatum]